MEKLNPLHYKYIILILALSLLSIIVSNTATNKQLVDYVSFAATLSSLILAVLAIIQGFLSNDSISTSIGQLRDSSSAISANSKEMANLINNFESKFLEVPQTLQNLRSDYNQIASRFVKDSINFEKKESNPSAESIAEFVNTLSVYPMLSLYIAYLSLKTKKNFDTNKIVPEDNPLNPFTYMFLGGLNIIEGVGVIDLKITKDELEVVSIHEAAGDIPVKLSELIAKRGKKKASHAQKFKNFIDEYFEI